MKTRIELMKQYMKDLIAEDQSIETTLVKSLTDVKPNEFFRIIWNNYMENVDVETISHEENGDKIQVSVASANGVLIYIKYLSTDSFDKILEGRIYEINENSLSDQFDLMNVLQKQMINELDLERVIEMSTQMIAEKMIYDVLF